jgi:hypothetical protein
MKSPALRPSRRLTTGRPSTSWNTRVVGAPVVVVVSRNARPMPDGQFELQVAQSVRVEAPTWSYAKRLRPKRP